MSILNLSSNDPPDHEFAIAGFEQDAPDALLNALRARGSRFCVVSMSRLLGGRALRQSMLLLQQTFQDQCLPGLVCNIRSTNPGIGIIVVGKSSDIGVISNIIAVGADDYVTLPCDDFDVISRINAINRNFGVKPLPARERLGPGRLQLVGRQV